MGRRETLKAIKDALSEHITVEAVYLFGSRARGTFQDDSDYDIAIISPDFDDMSFDEQQQLVKPVIRDILGLVALDVVCYTPEQFQQGSTGFLPQRIIDEGIKV